MPDPCHLSSGLEAHVARLWRAQAEVRAGIAAGDPDRIEVALDVIELVAGRARFGSALRTACARALICLHDELLMREAKVRDQESGIRDQAEVGVRLPDPDELLDRFVAAGGPPEGEA